MSKLIRCIECGANGAIAPSIGRHDKARCAECRERLAAVHSVGRHTGITFVFDHGKDIAYAVCECGATISAAFGGDTDAFESKYDTWDEIRNKIQH